MSSQFTADPSYNKLIRNARKALSLLQPRTPSKEALAHQVALALEAVDEARRLASISSSGDETPVEVARAMRSPAGRDDRTVVVYHDGMVIKAAIHPIGKRSPAREAAVWRCMRDTAIKVREGRM